MPSPKDDSDFEINFYKRLLEKSPNFVEALMALGDVYTKKGMYQEGLEIDERLAKLRPYSSSVLYNLACSYSLLEDIHNAFNAIQRAIECGYRDFDYILKDRDLENLRQDKRFREYFSGLMNKKTS